MEEWNVGVLEGWNVGVMESTGQAGLWRRFNPLKMIFDLANAGAIQNT